MGWRAEAKRVRDLGLIGLMARPNHLYGRNLGAHAKPSAFLLNDLPLDTWLNEGRSFVAAMRAKRER